MTVDVQELIKEGMPPDLIARTIAAVEGYADAIDPNDPNQRLASEIVVSAQKDNPYHDEQGRFTHQGGGGAPSEGHLEVGRGALVGSGLMYHVTEGNNVARIEKEGLHQGTAGITKDDLVGHLYPGPVVFVSEKPDYRPSSLEQRAQFKVDMHGLPLLPDLGELIDQGAQLDETADPELWWEEGTEPAELKPYLKDGAVTVAQLFSDASVAAAAIRATGTAAVLGPVPASRLSAGDANRFAEPSHRLASEVDLSEIPGGSSTATKENPYHDPRGRFTHAGGEGTSASELGGGDPYRIIDLDYTTGAGLQRNVPPVLDLIRSVHQIPPIARATISCYHPANSFDRFAGDYNRGRRSIRLSPNLPNEDFAGVLVHEIGHSIDHGLGDQMLGPGDMYWSAAAALTGRSESDMKVLLRELGRSSSITAIKNIRDANSELIADNADRFSEANQSAINKTIKYAEYLTRPWEMFARAYVQYIAEKTQDPGLLTHIEPKTQDLSGRRFWTPNDFLPIRAKMDDLFAEQGLLK